MYVMLYIGQPNDFYDKYVGPTITDITCHSEVITITNTLIFMQSLSFYMGNSRRSTRANMGDKASKSQSRPIRSNTTFLVLAITNFNNAFLDYYDKYGAPMSLESAFEEGYHAIEIKAADYWDKITKCQDLDFPLIAGIGGGAHLYKDIHYTDKEGSKPWNITGWIPRQKIWLSQGTFFSNR
jgi:hypothetical protein